MSNINQLHMEMRVLAGFMSRPSAILETLLQPDDFSEVTAGIMFATIKEIVDKDGVPEYSVIKMMYAERGYGEPAQAMLDAVSRTVINTANISSYEKFVLQASRARKIKSAAQMILNSADSSEEGLKKAIELTGELINEINRAQAKRPKPISDVAKKFEADIQRASKLGRPSHMKTGYKSLDAILGGIIPSKLYVIAARPSVGKSALGFNVARNVASGGHGVLIASIEMPDEEIVSRYVSDIGGVNNSNIRDATLSPDELIRISDSVVKISKLPIFIADDPTISVGTLESHIIEYRNRISLVVVDYLQLMTGDEDGYSEVTKVSSGLRRLSRQYKLPIIALAQLSRAPAQRADQRPILTDIRSSGKIEQDADVVIFMHRKVEDDGTLASLVELIVAKYRGGKTGVCRLYFEGELLRFSEFVYSDMPQENGDEQPEPTDFY